MQFVLHRISEMLSRGGALNHARPDRFCTDPCSSASLFVQGPITLIPGRRRVWPRAHSLYPLLQQQQTAIALTVPQLHLAQLQTVIAAVVTPQIILLKGSCTTPPRFQKNVC